MCEKIIVSIDMRKEDSIIEKLAKKYKNYPILLIIDPDLIHVVSDYLIENGWLGEGTTEELKNILLSNLQILRKKWIENEKADGIKVDCKDGNFKDILESEIKKGETKELVVCFKKGFNIYWKVTKPIIENICKKHSLNLTILTD